MDDESFKAVFQPIIGKIMEKFQPGAVVLQCGATVCQVTDWDASTCLFEGMQTVQFMRGYDVPLLVLGGGGYTLMSQDVGLMKQCCWIHSKYLPFKLF